MNLKLSRLDSGPDGVFGELTDETGAVICKTLEHSYDGKPKLPPGMYTCVRGFHRLERSLRPFETFEITNVPDHTNILIHVGNFNEDSEGCVLVGLEIRGKMLYGSGPAFKKFMDLQKGEEDFTLVVQ